MNNKLISLLLSLEIIISVGTSTGCSKNNNKIEEKEKKQIEFKTKNENENESIIIEEENEPTITKTIDELAYEVINGLWGIDEERKTRLEEAGYDYDKIQSRVNEIINEQTKKLYGNVGYVNCNSNIRDTNGNIIKVIEPYQKVLIYDDIKTFNVNNENLDFLHVCIPNDLEGYMYIENITKMPNTYIEVDISLQKLYLYIDGELVLEANVITGNPNNNCSTDLGYTEIYEKRYQTVLQPYGSYVDVFMPFNYSEGFHDADAWRSDSEFDIKDYYLTNGSHGCVNMKQNDVDLLDQYTSIGTKVLIHN